MYSLAGAWKVQVGSQPLQHSLRPCLGFLLLFPSVAAAAYLVLGYTNVIERLVFFQP